MHFLCLISTRNRLRPLKNINRLIRKRLLFWFLKNRHQVLSSIFIWHCWFLCADRTSKFEWISFILICENSLSHNFFNITKCYTQLWKDDDIVVFHAWKCHKCTTDVLFLANLLTLGEICVIFIFEMPEKKLFFQMKKNPGGGERLPQA